MSEANLERDKARCLRNGADEVWVPTQWHIDRFVAAGLPRARLHVVPEPVDVDFFSPQAAAAATTAKGPFTFFSVFKWEQRKGWDLLLNAFWSEFGGDSATTSQQQPLVKLVLKTYLPSWEPGPPLAQQLELSAQRFLRRPRSELPPVELVEGDASRGELRRLYAAAHAFVLPTRGEGWGLPIAEAMAMGLPAIATNFSGPTAFLTSENGHPLPVARHLPDGAAEPDVADVRKAMRRAFDEHATGEGAARGARGRADMVARFSRAAVADVVMARLRVLARKHRNKQKKKEQKAEREDLRRLDGVAEGKTELRMLRGEE